MKNAQIHYQTQAMVGYLKIAVKSLIDKADWMDGLTKQAAKRKLDAMRQFVGYPDWILNQTALDDYYQGVGAIFIYFFFLYDNFI